MPHNHYCPRRATRYGLVSLATQLIASVLAANAAPPNDHPPSATGRRVVDVEKLTVVAVPRFPSDMPTCQALVIGGGIGGVAAAEDLARAGISVIVTEPTSHLGGQFTSQGVSVPDENSYIEKKVTSRADAPSLRAPGTATRHYAELREQVRAIYAAVPGVTPTRVKNVGVCWASRVSGEPAVWERAIRDRLAHWQGLGHLQKVLTRNQLLDIQRYPGNGQISYADFVDLDTGRITRIGAQYVLDATETGDALPMAGSPWTLGQESQSEFQEPDAPEVAHPEWVQSFTYSFDARWVLKEPAAAMPATHTTTQPQAPGDPGDAANEPRNTAMPVDLLHPLVPKPDEYDAFKALGEYTLVYDYPLPRGPIPYQMLAKAPGASGPFWTYRRIVAASSFHNNPDYAQDISLINWRGNDFRLESFIGKSPNEHVRILKRAKDYALGFLYWLQTECPRDDGGSGYPEIQPATTALGTDGFAPAPYIRESRRLLAEYTLTENDMIAARQAQTALAGGNADAPVPPRPVAVSPQPADPTAPSALPAQGAGAIATGTDFFDSAGIALYSIDIHPAQGEPHLLAPALPYEIPLGSYIPRSGPTNIIPAAKNFGATRLALASARMHPIEWLSGEIAGHLAAFCLQRGTTPHAVRTDSELLQTFQRQLENDGITTRWAEVAPNR